MFRKKSLWNIILIYSKQKAETRYEVSAFNFESTGFKVNYSISCFLSLLLALSFAVLGFLASRAASRFILALSK